MLKEKLNPEDFALGETILVVMYNNEELTHESLLDLFIQKKFGVGTYCKWMTRLGLKEQIEPQFVRQYYQKRIAI